MEHFQINYPTVISFSGGRTSAYMLWRVLQANDMKLPNDAKVIFCNTGLEHEGTLSFVGRCQREWNIEIIWLEYANNENKFIQTNYDNASRKGEPFDALTTKRNYLPNPVARFCTAELKILTIERYMKSIGIDDFETMIGIRADEPQRIVKMRETKLTPLASAGITQMDVQKFWSENNFDLTLQFRNGVTPWGNCTLCFLKGPNQIMSMIAYDPKQAIWWANQEKKIGGTFRSDRPSYSDMMLYAKEQGDMFDFSNSISCFCGE
jgi:3'-phosphoadenosine 5'-phosphosulfate sulfotransferase (PAPS reductase)/FAD synthetase